MFLRLGVRAFASKFSSDFFVFFSEVDMLIKNFRPTDPIPKIGSIPVLFVLLILILLLFPFKQAFACPVFLLSSQSSVVNMVSGPDEPAPGVFYIPSKLFL